MLNHIEHVNSPVSVVLTCTVLTLSTPAHKMLKHTKTIRRLLPTNCLSVFDHFVGLALKGLRVYERK